FLIFDPTDRPGGLSYRSTASVFPSLIVSRQPVGDFSSLRGWCASTNSTARFTISTAHTCPEGGTGGETGVTSSGTSPAFASRGSSPPAPSPTRTPPSVNFTTSAGVRNVNFTRTVSGGSAVTPSTDATHGCVAKAAVSLGASSGSIDWKVSGNLEANCT